MKPLTTAQAQATQRAIHDAYAPLPLTPLPDVYESDWNAWDTAVRMQDPKPYTAHQHTMWRAINE